MGRERGASVRSPPLSLLSRCLSQIFLLPWGEAAGAGTNVVLGILILIFFLRTCAVVETRGGGGSFEGIRAWRGTRARTR